MKHAVRPIHFVRMVVARRKQGSRLRDATGPEGRRMPTGRMSEGEMRR
jgi:hypothetical protein